MTTQPDPHHHPAADEADALPGEEDVDSAQVDDQLTTSPEEARNFTDGYSPAADPADPEIYDADDLED